MTGRIYLLGPDSKLAPMTEAPYDSEAILQELLASHPDLLAGEQIDSDEPRRWLLVKREMVVGRNEDAAARWAVDHLFLDQDAVPTHPAVLRQVVSASRATGNLAHDAHIAGLLIEHGVRELWTADRDFARFAGIKVHDPFR